MKKAQMARTSSDGIQIAILQTQMEGIEQDISDIKKDIKDIKDTLSPYADHEKRLRNLETSSNLWKWLAPTLTGLACTLLTGILMFLITQYLQNL